MGFESIYIFYLAESWKFPASNERKIGTYPGVYYLLTWLRDHLTGSYFKADQIPRRSLLGCEWLSRVTNKDIIPIHHTDHTD